MNKSEFIKELSKQTGYDEEKCIVITFIIGKKNKDKMIEKFEEQISLDENEANKLYETVISIIGSELKNKLKHPFKSQD